MRLMISSQPGLIGIQTTRGQLNMTNTPARLDIHQEQGIAEIQTRPPVLEIDQYASRAQLGYKKPSDVASEAAMLAAQQVLEYIAQKAEEGNRLKAIEQGGNPIREIAMDKAWPQKQRQGGYVPIVGPEFHCTPAEINITPPEVKNPVHIGYEANFVPGEQRIEYRPGNVKIYMRQYPQVRIDVML